MQPAPPSEEYACRSPANPWGLAYLLSPFVKGEKRGSAQEHERHHVIPLQAFTQINDRKNGKYQQGDDFLHGLELGGGIDLMADAVGRHRQAIFEKRRCPN